METLFLNRTVPNFFLRVCSVKDCKGELTDRHTFLGKDIVCESCIGFGCRFCSFSGKMTNHKPCSLCDKHCIMLLLNQNSK